jgi:oxygen-dependent protoporphyrinogen oxidase
MRRFVVVGAGLGGLAAAHRLEELARERGEALELVVLEESSRPGGVVGSETVEGALIERGPDLVVTHKPAALSLCERLGLGDRVVHPAPGRTHVLHRGRLTPVPSGFTIRERPRIGPLLGSSLLTWRGKFRALAGTATADEDESVAAFSRRRHGGEYYERLVEPIAGGLFMADLERLSLAAAFPPRTPGAGPPFATLRGGLGQLADALVARLPRGALRLGVRAERVLRDDDGFAVDVDGHLLRADGVILAVPAPAAAALIHQLAPDLSALLGEIPFASCATVHVAWPRDAVSLPESHGFFVPRTARLPLVAATLVHRKHPDRVPGERALVRAFLGGALHPEIADRSDRDLGTLATTVLGSLLRVRAPATWTHVVRHPRAMPQPPVGHSSRLARIGDRLALLPGLELAGGPVGAYGLPDAIASAEEAAARVLDRPAQTVRE